MKRGEPFGQKKTGCLSSPSPRSRGKKRKTRVPGGGVDYHFSLAGKREGKKSFFRNPRGRKGFPPHQGKKRGLRGKKDVPLPKSGEDHHLFD